MNDFLKGFRVRFVNLTFTVTFGPTLLAEDKTLGIALFLVALQVNWR